MSAWRMAMAALVVVMGFASVACQLPPSSILNGWLDPTIVGSFAESKMIEIRASLTLEDDPAGIPAAVFPGPEDLELIYEDYPISAGDTLAVEIYELRDRQIPYQAQLQVSSMGLVNIPAVGRVKAAGLTPTEFEQSLADTLVEKDILRDPEVTVSPVYLQKATYSIFGIGVSASTDAPLRAGTFPIRSPELRILEAINQVGGLNEFVTDVFVFRNYVRPAETGEQTASEGDEAIADGVGEEFAAVVPDEPEPVDPVLEDLLAVVEDENGDGEAPEPDVDAAADLDTLAESLEPDPSVPYVFINGEFVQNPDYVPTTSDMTSRGSVVFGPPSPSVNWSRVAGETSYRVLLIPADMLREGDPLANIYVRPGDVIRIVQGEIGVYYVMGQVARVGAFRFNSESITMKGAIAAAGGLSSLAWPDRCTVYRRTGHREQMIQVNLDRIFTGQDADFLVRRGDIINVGTHPFAPFLQRIRALTLPNPVNNVGYSFTYARNFADIDSFAAQRNPANDTGQRFPFIFP